jgi:hypothetical protein
VSDRRTEAREAELDDAYYDSQNNHRIYRRRRPAREEQREARHEPVPRQCPVSPEDLPGAHDTKLIGKAFGFREAVDRPPLLALRLLSC